MMEVQWRGSNFGPIWVVLIWFQFGSDFDGSNFGDVVGLMWLQFCWVLLVICRFCLVPISVILLDWCGSDLFGSGGRWAVRPG